MNKVDELIEGLRAAAPADCRCLGCKFESNCDLGCRLMLMAAAQLQVMAARLSKLEGPGAAESTQQPERKQVYDFELADGADELPRLLHHINRYGYELIGVTQYRDEYTVFFRRPGP